MPGVKVKTGRKLGDSCPVSDIVLLELYRKHGGVVGVAEELGSNRSTVRGWMKNRGVQFKPPGGPNNFWGQGGKKGKGVV